MRENKKKSAVLEMYKRITNPEMQAKARRDTERKKRNEEKVSDTGLELK